MDAPQYRCPALFISAPASGHGKTTITAALARLGLTGDVLLVQADLALAIHETALAPDAGDFDGDRLPIHVALVLRRTP